MPAANPAAQRIPQGGQWQVRWQRFPVYWRCMPAIADGMNREAVGRKI